MTLIRRERPVRHRASRVMAVVENLRDLGEIVGNVESPRCFRAAVLGTAGHRYRGRDELIDVTGDK
jgi:hypothetical protein